jgi:hypothetical protein
MGSTNSAINFYPAIIYSNYWIVDCRRELLPAGSRGRDEATRCLLMVAWKTLSVVRFYLGHNSRVGAMSRSSGLGNTGVAVNDGRTPVVQDMKCVQQDGRRGCDFM